ncbi:MAG: patatin-like phospholipase family protein [Nocardioides sp.]|jgi:NTE family protein|uniref:patatin-like phospholipase family protein n=1 Tax=Nocardioides sp. TaxID=35761 RepID=UPI00261C22ED|nr:patatin-like phospholipase family protein [Nocardioides sp.]MCW2832435.1 patatin-like phospholipase family protein [Nocardioides sp.]
MPRTALVLGGGGLTGIGWEAGIIKGLADEGVDLSTADVVVGTSAGAVVGALITTRPVDQVYEEQVQPPSRGLGAPNYRRSMMLPLVPPMLFPGASRTKRRRVGAVALRAHPPGGHERVEVIRSRIGVEEWPDRDLRITAVNAETGEFITFTRDSDVDLVHAVAASCAVPIVWPAVSIDDTPYIDGGMRSTANADVASDATDVVVVLAPLPQAVSRSARISTQLGRCRAERYVVVTPDKQSLASFGSNVLDPARRPDAAREGRRQAADVIDEIRAAWRAVPR